MLLRHKRLVAFTTLNPDCFRFEPTINTNSLRILNESERLRGKTFWDRFTSRAFSRCLRLTRQRRQTEALQEKEAKRHAAAADSNDFTFTPVVNENSMILASAIDRANESFIDRVERLSFNDNVGQRIFPRIFPRCESVTL